MDPQTGRFLSRDPSGGGLSRPYSRHGYLYASARPTRYVDSRGREDEPVDDQMRIRQCDELRGNIVGFAGLGWYGGRKGVLQRFIELLLDHNDLFHTRPFGPNSWQGHVNEYNDRRQDLSDDIKRYDRDGCDKLESPSETAQMDEARKIANTPAPDAPLNVIGLGSVPDWVRWLLPIPGRQEALDPITAPTCGIPDRARCYP